ncbi:MAG: hypothetical protein QGG48_05550, partial [Desulfatiglandales bacterium]|nr:hypothetical protein [Desulfatiglandales bacterium]
KEANGSTKKNEEVRSALDELKNESTALQRSKQNIVRSIAKGIISDKDAGTQMSDLNSRDEEIQKEMDSLNDQIKDRLTKSEIKTIANNIRPDLGSLEREADHSYLGSQAHLNEMTYNDKRALFQQLFMGTDSKGRRNGIYVKKGKTAWLYRVRGRFAPFTGRAKLTDKNDADMCQVWGHDGCFII